MRNARIGGFSFAAPASAPALAPLVMTARAGRRGRRHVAMERIDRIDHLRQPGLLERIAARVLQHRHLGGCRSRKSLRNRDSATCRRSRRHTRAGRVLRRACRHRRRPVRSGRRHLVRKTAENERFLFQWSRHLSYRCRINIDTERFDAIKISNVRGNEASANRGGRRAASSRSVAMSPACNFSRCWALVGAESADDHVGSRKPGRSRSANAGSTRKNRT